MSDSDFLFMTDNGTVDAVKGAFEVIGENRLQAWVRYAVGADSDKLVQFIRVNYLTCQKLNIVTGETRDHIGTWTMGKFKGKKFNRQVIRPGKGIDGVQNYIAKWTGTEHEFMMPAFRAFGAEARFSRDIKENILKMGNKALAEAVKERP